jgi:hypothetical protein
VPFILYVHPWRSTRSTGLPAACGLAFATTPISTRWNTACIACWSVFLHQLRASNLSDRLRCIALDLYPAEAVS